MKTRCFEMIQACDGGLLDAMHALQEEDGYLTQDGIAALSEAFDLFPSQIYDSASFYSMIRLSPPSEVSIQICRGAPCHVAGASEVIKALEEALGIPMGSASPDGKYSLSYTECIGQCQAAPSILVNGTLHTEMTPEKAKKIIERGAKA